MKNIPNIVFAFSAASSAICLLLAFSNHLPFEITVAAFATNGLLALASLDFAKRGLAGEFGR